MIKNLKLFIIMTITIMVVATAGCISEQTNSSNLHQQTIPNYTTTSSNNEYTQSLKTTQSSQQITQHNSKLNSFINTHEHWEGVVVKVTDGDTDWIQLDNGSRIKVRLLGVDTPEIYHENDYRKWVIDGKEITDEQWLHSWGEKAKYFAEEEIGNKHVIIVFDNIAPKKGYYGRYLVYIYFNNSGRLDDFNEELLENGYARVYSYYKNGEWHIPNFELKDKFLKEEEFAKEHHLGVWNWTGDSFSKNTLTTPTSNENTKATGANIVIYYIHADASGNDNHNLNDEYIVFKNTGSLPIDLSGWEVKDEAGHTYIFPSGFVLQPGKTVTLHTGSGVDTNSDLYWGSSRAIWNNNGDTIYVIDSSGNVVITKHYT